MTRHRTFKLAVIAAAVIAIGGRWGLVRAQPIGSATPAITAGPAAEPSDKPAPRTPALSNQTGVAFGAYSARVSAGNDPEMAKLADAEKHLSHDTDELLSQYVVADKADDQKRLKAELRDMLAKQFDVQRQRRELELSRIEERVKKLRNQIKKRADARETIVDRRLEQLVNEAEGLGWGQAAGSAAIDQQGTDEPHRNPGRHMGVQAPTAIEQQGSDDPLVGPNVKARN